MRLLLSISILISACLNVSAPSFSFNDPYWVSGFGGGPPPPLVIPQVDNLLFSLDGTTDESGNLIDTFTASGVVFNGNGLTGAHTGYIPCHDGSWNKGPVNVWSSSSSVMPFTSDGQSYGTVAVKMTRPVSDGNPFHVEDETRSGVASIYISSASHPQYVQLNTSASTFGGFSIDSALVLPSSGYHWYIVTWDTAAGIFQVAIDGVVETYALYASESDQPYGTTSFLVLGSNGTFNIQRVLTWKVALTPSEIAQLK